jgi:hypothetical protein
LYLLEVSTRLCFRFTSRFCRTLGWQSVKIYSSGKFDFKQNIPVIPVPAPKMINYNYFSLFSNFDSCYWIKTFKLFVKKKIYNRTFKEFGIYNNLILHKITKNSKT